MERVVGRAGDRGKKKCKQQSEAMVVDHQTALSLRSAWLAKVAGKGFWGNSIISIISAVAKR
jgi:hypothetical protein